MHLIFLCVLFFFSLHHTSLILFFFFFNDTATTEIYTLSLHDALPILTGDVFGSSRCDCGDQLKLATKRLNEEGGDRKSTRLNSSHLVISYAVFCLKKKKKKKLSLMEDNN